MKAHLAIEAPDDVTPESLNSMLFAAMDGPPFCKHAPRYVVVSPETAERMKDWAQASTKVRQTEDGAIEIIPGNYLMMDYGIVAVTVIAQ